MERYRLFIKNGHGTYDVSSGTSRFDALHRYQTTNPHPKKIEAICLIKGNGTQRIYKL